jgi:hypothetical protein
MTIDDETFRAEDEMEASIAARRVEGLLPDA